VFVEQLEVSVELVFCEFVESFAGVVEHVPVTVISSFPLFPVSFSPDRIHAHKRAAADVVDAHGKTRRLSHILVSF
jgi:hypothetical protein